MRKIVTLIAAVVAAFALSVSPAFATDSNHVLAPHDSFVDNVNTTTNYGQNATVDILNTGTPTQFGHIKRGWFKFNTSLANLGLPVGATVTAAHVKFYLDSTDVPSPDGELTLFPAPCSVSGTAWDEDVITWNNQPSVTGFQLGVRSIYNGSGVLRPSVTFDLSSQFELSQINTGSPTCFAMETSADYDIRVESHENGDNAKRPEMWVEYTV